MQVLKLFEEGSYELVRTTACARPLPSACQESKQTIPHFYVSVDCELDALLALRSELNKAAPVKDGKPAYKLSVNDMTIKALALGAARRAGRQCLLDRRGTWSSTSMPMSALPCRSRAA
jgi:pyruvate/2-oxoglutarate dehydrogenase complex dihydrolipoamide acyltransferase (E2) component